MLHPRFDFRESLKDDCGICPGHGIPTGTVNILDLRHQNNSANDIIPKLYIFSMLLGPTCFLVPLPLAVVSHNLTDPSRDISSCLCSPTLGWSPVLLLLLPVWQKSQPLQYPDSVPSWSNRDSGSTHLFRTQMKCLEAQDLASPVAAQRAGRHRQINEGVHTPVDKV